VVFSFFKKDPKDGKDGSRGTAKAGPRTPPKPVGKPMPDPAARNGALPNSKFATTENALPRDLARSLAMETAAKIDAIESEMARDFLRPAANTGSPAADPTTRGRPTGNGVPPAPARPPSVNKKAEKAEVDSDDDTLEGGSDLLLGSLSAIELSSSGGGSVIDETAILFANGQAAEAEETLRQGLEGEAFGASAQIAWHMLFELLNQRSDKAAFEQLTMQYALRFENSPPAWIDYAAAGRPAPAEAPVAAAPAPAPAPLPEPAASMLPSGLPIIALPADVDANVVKALELLKTMAAQHSALAIDASQVRSVDLVGAELLLRVVNAFKRSSHELSILGCEQLQVPLRSAVEPGRRDASDAAWMLLLEVLRLLDKQHDFEETGIQYCITFEVSPPSWEPPPPNLKTGPAPARTAAPAPAPVAAPAAMPAAAVVASPALGPLDWRGVVDGEGEPQFGRMVAEARSSKHLLIECRYLQRMGFSAASALLTHVMKLQSGGVRIEFRNVNPLVAALLTLLGVSAVATVQPRRP
jgi:anti-anti-sigma regulatory factor